MPSASSAYIPGDPIDDIDVNSFIGNPTGTPVNGNKLLQPFSGYNSWSTVNLHTGNTNASGISIYNNKIYVVDSTIYVSNSLTPSDDNGWSTITLHTGNANASGISIYNNKIYVVDSTDNQIYVSDDLDPSSDSDWSTITLHTENTNASGITVYGNKFYIVDSTSNRIYVSTNMAPSVNNNWNQYNLHGNNTSASGISIYGSYKKIYVVDSTDNQIYVSNSLTPSGSSNWSTINLDSRNANASDISIYDGKIYVIDSSDNDIYINNVIFGIAAIYGIGYGDLGYGITTPGLTRVSEGSVVATQPWQNIRSAIRTTARHQGTLLTPRNEVSELPPEGEFNRGEIIEAFNASDTDDIRDVYDIDKIIGILDRDKHRYNAQDMSRTNGVYTDIRGSSWGSGSSATIRSELSLSFNDINHARYFFNTGGAIIIKISHVVSGGTSQDTAWNTFLSRSVGDIVFGAQNGVLTTSNTGIVDGTSNLNFYTLTGSYQSLYGSDLTSGTYSTNRIDVSAQISDYSSSGTNGGHGRIIRIRAMLTDNYNRDGFIDRVNSGTRLSIDIRRCTGGSSRISIHSPTISAVSRFGS